MNGKKLSPLARLLASLSLVVGILVVDHHNTLFSGAAGAQTQTEAEATVSEVVIGTTIPVTSGTVAGGLVRAQGVILDGVPTDVVIGSSVQLLNAVVVSSDYMSVYGVVVSGDKSNDGVVVSGDVATSGSDEDGGSEMTGDGVVVSGDVMAADGVVVSGDRTLTMSGGTLRGTNIRIVDGILYGDDLTLEGVVVSGDVMTVSGVVVKVDNF